MLIYNNLEANIGGLQKMDFCIGMLLQVSLDFQMGFFKNNYESVP